MESVNTPTGDDALKTAKRLIKETIPKRKKIITASILCMLVFLFLQRRLPIQPS